MRLRKSVAIAQSNYIPWKGYFDLIGLVDEFVLFDDRQYTRRDWRNRNLIKTPRGAEWLTIPIQVKGRYLQRIDEALVQGQHWASEHWRALCLNYARAEHFGAFREIFQALYAGAGREERLSDVNRLFVDAICRILKIDTTIRWSTDYAATGVKTERLVSICRQAGAERYLSGPAAKSYIDERLFTDAGIELAWMDYSGYPEYRQLYPPFDHHVTVLDLIFNAGEASPDLMKFRTAGQVAAD